MDDSITIGKNILQARKEKGMTQRQLSELAEISQTQLSDYENGNRTPGLFTIAKIARCLEKSIDELYYGDASVSFITSAPDEGRMIANCVFQLWKQGVIRKHVPSEDEARYPSSIYLKPVVDLDRYSWAVQRLLDMLDDFAERRYTFKNPELYLEQVLDSVAREINPKQD